MNSYRTTLRVGAVTALVIPALLVGPATDADALKVTDQKGDAPSGIDITHYKAENGKKSVTITLTFRRLNPRSIRTLAGYVYPKSGAKTRTYFAFGVARRGSRTGSYFMKYVKNEGKDKKCNEGSKLVGVNKVRIKAPQKCFGKYAGKMAFTTAIWNLDGKVDRGKPARKWVKRG